MFKLPAAALCLALAGCSSSAAPESAVASRAADLFAARTAYLGDNNRVLLLVNKTSPVTAGDFTIELQTARPPLGLTVNIVRLGKPFAPTDWSQPATLLLGLIANVEQVTFTAGRDTVTFTAASASTTAGFDVKQLGKDQKVLADYLGKTD